MTLREFFKTSPRGTRADVARKVDIASTYLYQIENGLRPIPPNRVLDIAKATNWKVTPHDLRPDIYPNPSDGMPAGKPTSDEAA